MTAVAQALREAAIALGAASASPRLDAELLMAHALGCSRSQMLLRHSRDEAPVAFAALVARRQTGVPVSQIVGAQEFYGLIIKVTPDVLTPRADSETLIDAARDELADCPPRRILDLGTGPGTLLLAALSVWPEAQGIGIERSAAALAVARENARLLGMNDRCAMQEGDWHAEDWSAPLGTFDLVLANPPYVETDDPDLAADVRAHEPAEALFAGADGLDDYRVLIPQVPALLTPDGIAVIEIGSRQSGPVGALAATAGLSASLHRDLGANPRALLLRNS